ncbi:MAG: sulfite exporter TauE/SafE family protein [Actinomycetes bacterium]
MDLSATVALAGLFVGFVVGLTGMGGGALMTPMMILLFGVQPLAAVSSDLVASMIMKPVGGAVHLRRGTVNRELVGWLVLGSVPSAFCGVLVLRAVGHGDATQAVVRTSLGIALLFAAGSMIAKALLDLRKTQRARAAGIVEVGPGDGTDVRIKPLPTLLVGVAGGLVVGMTSVGSGSLMIVALLLLYPTLRARQLVGTDLVQAVPLVASASLGHLLFGDFQLGLTSSLLIGALPGVYVGARVSSSAPGGVVRRALVVVLLASGLKLLDASTAIVVAALAAVVVLGPVLWASVYRTAAPEVAEGRGASGLARAAVTGRWSRPRAGKSSEDRSTAG